jgi:hypothetical protein
LINVTINKAAIPSVLHVIVYLYKQIQDIENSFVWNWPVSIKLICRVVNSNCMIHCFLRYFFNLVKPSSRSIASEQRFS